jgi:hypothetical protein
MMKSWSKAIIIIFLAIFFTSVSFTIEAKSVTVDSQLWVQREGICQHEIRQQPNGPMALVLFCEDALGTYIGLFYYGIMGSPVPLQFFSKLSETEKESYYKIWSLANRMWQEPVWASDVTSYAWSLDGTKLYVATSNIYGSGAFYELDLVRRKHRQIAPMEKTATINHPGPGYLITRIDKEEKKLFYGLVPWNQVPGETSKEQFIEMNK